MTHRELALEYLRCFCAADVAGLRPLLATDLRFSGTLHSYESAAAYLGDLRLNPPQQCQYKVLSVTDGEDSVAVFYAYHKPDRVLQIAQLFRFRQQKIAEILLIFDGRGLG